mgnify:CR=1 FL=1
MEIQGPIEAVYGLTIVFLIITIVFLMGKGSSFIVGHNTLQETRFEPKKYYFQEVNRLRKTD